MQIIFSFPRFYLNFNLFGREFSADVGWFESDIQEDWAFGPELTLLAKLTGGKPGKGWVSYWNSLGFLAFQHKLAVSVGTVRYDA